MPLTIKTKPVVDTDSGLNNTKFKPILLISIYRYAKLGMPDTAIYDAIKITKKTWFLWKRKFPCIQEAIDIGRGDANDGGNWHKFVYDRLAPDLKELWGKIESWDEFPNGVVKIETLLQNHGKTVRQQLFLYALIHSNFSASRACAKVNIDKTTLGEWISKDPQFAELVEEIQWHKDNFFEEKFIELVREGDTSAIIHAAKSRLRNRGYGVKSEIDHRHDGNIQVDHNLLDLAELELSPGCRIELLDAIRRRDERKQKERDRVLQPIELQALPHLESEISNVEP